MGEKFLIEGQRPLEGKVEISGAKNDAGPIIASTLLTRESCVIDNLPLVEDIFCLLEILRKMGANIEWQGKRKIKIENKDIDPKKIDSSLVTKSRVSVLLIGPLLSRFNEFKISPPGGDKIIGEVRTRGGARMGLRPITTHLDALKKIGVESKRKGSFYYFKREDLRQREIVLKEFSVTATENLMMLASKIPGKTVIKGTAAEPHVQDLGRMLQDMGAKVKGISTHTIEIRGKENLKGVYHKIIPDHLEAGTFAIIGAATPGILGIRNLIFEHLDLFLAKLEEMGVAFEKEKNSLKIDFSPNLKGVRIQALPWPGFPTDLLPIIAPLLTQAKGRSLIHDPLYENRLNFLHQLRKMGADIEIVDSHRAFVFGKTPLFGIEIPSWDIRAGASFVVAALVAKGQTMINDVYQIDRGYEKIDEKLRKLGAKIKRIRD